MNTGDPGGDGSAAASPKNKSPAGGDFSGSLAETSKAPAQSARETDEDNSNYGEGSAGSRSDSSSTMARIISPVFVI